MLQGQRIAVVLPAYNAAATLERTYQEIPQDLVDEVLLVDDARESKSRDRVWSVSCRITPIFILWGFDSLPSEKAIHSR